MLTPEEYRIEAEACLKLARTYLKIADCYRSDNNVE
jgi:hypothetical protein